MGDVPSIIYGLPFPDVPSIIPDVPSIISGLPFPDVPSIIPDFPSTGPISGTGPTETPSRTGCKDDENFEWKGKSCEEIAEKDKCKKKVNGKKLRKSCKESCGKCPKPPTL